MYPNPQDVLPLPPHPDLEHYRRRAKELVKACKSGDQPALHAWALAWVGDLYRLQTGKRRPNNERELHRQVEQVASFARERLGAQCALTQAQFVIARAQGFLSWEKFARHVSALGVSDTATSAFERAADAIVAGDLATLDRLLDDNPGLIRERSTREHQATLLHYVSANGVENYRQHTPANIVAIARRLLDAGAEVDAEADVYGGGVKTLGLTVTSAHPRLAGVQNELADLLLSRGARLESGMVRGCLANGCPEAALHLVARYGVTVDLEEAAGTGLIDVVRAILDHPGARPTEREAVNALMMACWYDRRDVVELLLDRILPVDARAADDGNTALHIAAYQGNPEMVAMLLARGAPVNLNDRKYGTPPFVWALQAWLVGQREGGRYPAVLRLLAKAGAEVKPEWLDNERIRAEPELAALLEQQR